MDMGITPVEKEITVKKSIEDIRKSIIEQIENMNGRIVKNEENYIESDFGSLLKSRLLGEFFVSTATLPKRAEIKFESLGNNETKVKILVRDTHKYGIKAGYVKKYEKALRETAESIIKIIK